MIVEDAQSGTMLCVQATFWYSAVSPNGFSVIFGELTEKTMIITTAVFDILVLHCTVEAATFMQSTKALKVQLVSHRCYSGDSISRVPCPHPATGLA